MTQLNSISPVSFKGAVKFANTPETKALAEKLWAKVSSNAQMVSGCGAYAFKFYHPATEKLAIETLKHNGVNYIHVANPNLSIEGFNKLINSSLDILG